MNGQGAMRVTATAHDRPWEHGDGPNVGVALRVRPQWRRGVVSNVGARGGGPNVGADLCVRPRWRGGEVSRVGRRAYLSRQSLQVGSVMSPYSSGRRSAIRSIPHSPAACVMILFRALAGSISA